ncbi:hypothetical protein AB0M79_36325, partial [Polymorphospora sp. NPDC051019]|uniref:hypothetical protein n=1 Tax=Polymorphospora sp. NPDC051019 TaxID=3155725 RepID=UPI0034461B23
AVIVVCGELVLRRRLGDVRRAALVRRSFRDIAGGWLLWLCIASFVLLVMIVVVGAQLADSSGQALAYGNPGSSRLAVSDFTAGIFPGFAYGVSLLGGALMVMIVCAAALRLIEARPALQEFTADASLRRLSGQRVLSGCAAALLIAAGGACFAAGVAVAEAFTGGLWHISGLIVALTGVMLAAAGALISVLPVLRFSRSAWRRTLPSGRATP